MSIRGLSCITEILNGRRANTGDTALRLGLAVKRSPGCRPGQAGGGPLSMVSLSAPRPVTGAFRKMGTEGRRAGCRGSYQEDEDPLGDVQQRRPPNLAES